MKSGACTSASRPKRHFFDRQRFVHAADDAFTLERGRTLGLVGESGSGKTTVARGVMRLVKPASGDVLLDGESVLPLHGDALSAFRRRVQFIFQDPYSSLNPRSRAGDIIREPMELLNVGPREERGGEVLRLMEAVGLRPDQARLFPHQFSGGQRQRIAIARALASRPNSSAATSLSPPSTSRYRHRSSTSCAGCKTISASATCSSPTISG
ncbi:MAG: ATP-binding cassette domain-containing protein [Bilophila wadsworthia]